MSDGITPITRFALSPVNDAAALKTYNARGLNSTGGALSGSPRNVVFDHVWLSAEARRLVSTAPSSFPERSAGLDALGRGVTRFSDADLSGAAFVGQILDGAVFANTILRDVNFVGASLRGAIFTASPVDGTRFNQADLSGADLTGAQGLTFAQIQGATTDAATVLPVGIGNDINGTFGANGAVPFSV
jgi:uncharacterized protein YjbI with pentapeptide repeats